MTSLFNVDLTINMPDGGRHARQLLNLYFADMPADINEAAAKLCGADKAAQERKFAKLAVKRSEVWSNPEHTLKIFALITVSGEDPAFIKQVIAQYMGGFAGCLKRASDSYFPRTGVRPDIPLEPTDWHAEVHSA